MHRKENNHVPEARFAAHPIRKATRRFLSIVAVIVILATKFTYDDTHELGYYTRDSLSLEKIINAKLIHDYPHAALVIQYQESEIPP